MKRAAGFKVLGMMGAGLALAGTGVAAPLAALADVDASSVQVIEREAIEYDRIPNVAGEFSFCQDALTPGDDVFNLFGIKNVSSYYWITDAYNVQYAVPNYLTGRQFNARLIVDF